MRGLAAAAPSSLAVSSSAALLRSRRSAPSARLSGARAPALRPRVVVVAPAADADAPMAPPEGPTQVPRADGVQDGEWNDLDARLVVESQDDANATYERSLPPPVTPRPPARSLCWA